jgi:hypothetical protein
LQRPGAAIKLLALLLKLLQQTPQFIRYLGDTSQAVIQQGRRFMAADGLAAEDATIAKPSQAAIALAQISQGLIGPIRRLQIGKLVHTQARLA